MIYPCLYSFGPEVLRWKQKYMSVNSDEVELIDIINNRKNRPRSRYPFLRKTVSVIMEYAGVPGTPL